MAHSTPITTSKRLMYNTALNLISTVITSLVGFLLISFFLGQLGEQRYGIWVLIASIFQYRGMLSIGLNSAVNRYIPVYLAQSNSDGVARIVSTSFFFLLLLGGVLAIASGIISLNFNNWFVLQADLAGTAQVLVLIVGLSYAVSFPLQISSAILSGIQRYDIINGVNLLVFIGRTALLVFLLLQGYGLLTMGFLFGGSEIIIRLLQFGFSKKLLPQAIVSFRFFNFELLRESTAYGINLLLYSMGTLILFKAGYIVIGLFLDSSQISRFSIAVAAILLLSGFTEVFSTAIKPAVSDLDARADTARVRDIALLTQKYTLLLLIPACCFFVAMGRDFLAVWVGSKIQDEAALNTMAAIMTIVTIAHTVRLAQHSNIIVLAGRGEHRIFGFFTVITAAIFLVLSVICLKFFNLGLISVAWSNFFPVVIIFGIILPRYVHHRLQITSRESILRVWMPALWGTLPTIFLIIIWKVIAPPQSWLLIGSVIASASAVTLCSSWILSLAPIEKRRIIGLIKRA